jgi:glycosyltransferase involved in cell wall biosynthesis
MAAPLTMGAGIKVKVIEAMSAGLPVLANDIAIEGIPAVNNVHYLHCCNPGDYAAAVGRIDKDRACLREISANAKKLVADVFNLDKSYSTYKQAIYKTCSAL